MGTFFNNIINRGTILQKIFLVLFIFNSTVILFYFSTQDYWGNHIKSYQYIYPYNMVKGGFEKKLIQRSDVLIGIREYGNRVGVVEGILDDTKKELKMVKGGPPLRYNYTNFGLTYQELFLWIFTGGFLCFCMYVFKGQEE